MTDDQLHVSKGITIKSLNDYVNTGSLDYSNSLINEDILQENELPSINEFTDLEESNNSPNYFAILRNKSIIDNIEYSENETMADLVLLKLNATNKKNSFNSESIIQKKLNNSKIIKNDNIENKAISYSKPQIYQTSKTNKPTSIIAEKNNRRINIPIRYTVKEELIRTEEFENDIDELDEVNEIAEEIDDISFLTEKIDKTKEGALYPGNIDIRTIDSSFEKEESYASNQDKEEENDITVFGVNKAEVYYAIDKQIYSKRAKKNINLSALKQIKSGLIAPLSAAIIPLLIFLIALPFLTVYFKKISVSTLEQNFNTDTSILSRIAKLKEEEANKMKLQLEEELRKINTERSRIEATINEELTKRRSEIEKTYKEKLQELLARSLPKEDFNRLKKALDMERDIALENAVGARNSKLIEQQRIISEKNKEIELAKNNIDTAIENKEYELKNIRETLNKRLEEQNKERLEATKKLDELRLYNDKVKNFTTKIVQLVSFAINSFKSGNLSEGVEKLNAVIQYYDSEKTFVLSEPSLSNRMTADIFLIKTISDLVENSKNSPYYDVELVKTLNQFKSMNALYNNAEELYTKRQYSDALKKYDQVLNEFDNVYSSYKRILSIEKEIQNTKALSLYNKAIEFMKANEYENALLYLTNVIKEAPQSDYSLQALENISRLSQIMPKQTKSDNVNAQLIFNKAVALHDKNQYRDALPLYRSIITDYTASDYTKEAFNRIIEIKDIISGNEMSRFEENLKRTFNQSYRLFSESYKKGELETARNHYFSALSNAFALYSQNSVDEFIIFENKYLQSLLEKSGANNNEVSEILLEEAKNTIEKKYVKIIDDYEEKLNAEIESNKKDKEKIIADYEKQLAEAKGNNADFKTLKDEYKAKLEEKDKQIALLNDKKPVTNYEELEKLKKQADEYAQAIKEKEKIIEELKNKPVNEDVSKENAKQIDDLKAQYAAKEKEINEERSFIKGLQEKLLDSYKENQELKENSETLAKKSSEKLSNELKDIKEKYSKLEQQSSRSRLNETQLRQQITDEVKKDYERTVLLEKERLQDEFSNELSKIQSVDAVENVNNKTNKQLPSFATQPSTKITARVIEIIDTSITFQFLSESDISNLTVGDTVKIVRLTGNGETDIALMKVTYTSNYSLFGRGRIISIVPGETIKSTDTIKK